MVNQVVRTQDQLLLLHTLELETLRLARLLHHDLDHLPHTIARQFQPILKKVALVKVQKYL